MTRRVPPLQSVVLVVETLVVGGQVVWTRAAVSLPALVLLLHLRHLLHRLHQRLRNHRLYTQLANHMSQKYVPNERNASFLPPNSSPKLSDIFGY